MAVHIHEIDLNKHERFLNEGRKDPYTKEKLKAGDRIVFCATCKSAFLHDSWEAMRGRHCEQSETLDDFPYIPRLGDVTKLEEENRTLSSSNFWIKGSAIISTITALSIGSFCYYQYQQIQQLQQENNQLQQNNRKIKVELEKQVKTLKEQVKSLTEDKNNLKSDISSVSATRDSLQKKVNELTTYTYVNFCNKTADKTITSAFTYWDTKSLRSKGWWVISPSKCVEVSVGQNYRGNIYVYGMYNRGEESWGSGSSIFCIDNVDAFDISNANTVSCDGIDQKRVAMTEFNVSPGSNKWDFSDPPVP